MANQNGNKEPRGNRHLRERLIDYSSVTRVSSAAGVLRGRLGNWPKYAAVAGSALAMATGASASIITNTISNATVTVPGKYKSSQKAVNFVSALAQLNDFVHLKANSNTQTSVRFAGLSVAGTGGGGVKFFEAASNTQLARIFTSHSRISAGAGPHLGSDAKIVRKEFVTSTGFGLFHSDQSGFAGMALNTTQGKIDYGWLDLKFTDLNGLPNTLEALAFGIETTPGAPIVAGQLTDVAPTPEPGSMGLALLASGAFGVAALRRRKAQAR